MVGLSINILSLQIYIVSPILQFNKSQSSFHHLLNVTWLYVYLFIENINFQNVIYGLDAQSLLLHHHQSVWEIPTLFVPNYIPLLSPISYPVFNFTTNGQEFVFIQYYLFLFCLYSTDEWGQPVLVFSLTELTEPDALILFKMYKTSRFLSLLTDL